MKLGELLAKKRDIESAIALYGASDECWRLSENFHLVVQKTYRCDEMIDTNFLKNDVPQEIIDAFKPLYETYRQYYKERTGKDLEPLKE